MVTDIFKYPLKISGRKSTSYILSVEQTQKGIGQGSGPKLIVFPKLYIKFHCCVTLYYSLLLLLYIKPNKVLAAKLLGYHTVCCTNSKVPSSLSMTYSEHHHANSHVYAGMHLLYATEICLNCKL